MIDIAFEEIDTKWVHDLVDSEKEEHKYLDYKRQLALNKGSEKKEFCHDVSSFANAGGGYLIYGIEEKQGKPTRIVGLSGIDADALIRQMESIARDGIEPRIPRIDTKPVTGPWDGPVIVMKVAKSWGAPHMVRESGRFYSRNSRGKYPLDVREIRAEFTGSEELPRRIQRFRDERLARIVAGETPVALRPGAFIALHVVPSSAFHTPQSLDVGKVYRDRGMLISRYFGSGTSRINLDGVLTYAQDRTDSLSSVYVQVFRNGCIEAVETTIVGPDPVNGRSMIRAALLEQEVIRGAKKSLEFLSSHGLTAPIVIFLTLSGVKGQRLKTEPEIEDRYCVDRDTLLLPDVLLEEYPTQVSQALRPLFDALWQSAGFVRCLNYDEAGEYRLNDLRKI